MKTINNYWIELEIKKPKRNQLCGIRLKEGGQGEAKYVELPSKHRASLVKGFATYDVLGRIQELYEIDDPYCEVEYWCPLDVYQEDILKRMRPANTYGF